MGVYSRWPSAAAGVRVAAWAGPGAALLVRAAACRTAKRALLVPAPSGTARAGLTVRVPRRNAGIALILTVRAGRPCSLPCRRNPGCAADCRRGAPAREPVDPVAPAAGKRAAVTGAITATASIRPPRLPALTKLTASEISLSFPYHYRLIPL